MAVRVAAITLLSLVYACQQSDPPVAHTIPQPSSTLSPMPNFVTHTYPGRNGYDVQYGSGVSSISATLDMEVIAEPGETLALDNMPNRIALLIDGEQQPDVLVGEGVWPNRATVGGEFVLDPGEHTVTVRAHRSSGEILQYSWNFTAFAEEPVLPGLPEGLQFVRPLPDSTITLQVGLQGDRTIR